ncbi:MAG: calcium/sodium antiporter [Prevotella sp.]|nr:calcium/sodium antiporter [Prevotella sp.]MBP3219702.1 calcium/sodium antiporter [Prevotella sp.]
MNILFIIIGIVLVLWGADRLTDGATAIAQRLNVPQIVIGLTVVAMGTSAPEFFVSFVSALKGTTDMAVGNVVGSNIFNTMLIVGVAAMVAPMTIAKNTVKKDIPCAVGASLMLAVMSLDNEISRLDAVLLFIAFLLFMAYTLRLAKTGEKEDETVIKKMKPLKAAFLVLLGLACLIVGSNLFVESASAVAKSLGVSDAMIGLTIVAGGTSLPELATSVVAAMKGRSSIAIGNVIGSNVFNILMILGITGIICPMDLHGITLVDMGVLFGSMLLLWGFSYTKYTVARWEGALLTVLFGCYMGWLIYQVM